MPIQNVLVASALQEIADRLEIQGANAFRVRAYRGAARTVEELPDDVKQMAERGETLVGYPGIGADLAGKIAEIAKTGTCELLQQLRRDMPQAITELLKVPGLGPKRVKTLWQALDLQTAEQVLRAARAGRIHELHGFGEKTERHIEEAVGARLSKEQRIKLSVAAEYADALVQYLKAASGVDRIVVAGSYRRMRETVGDLDVLVAARDGAAVIERFVRYPEAVDTLSHGPTRASVRLRGGLQIDLRVVPAASFGAALVYFTGSKAHNIALRRVGQELGLKVNEYGVFRGEKCIAGATEESVYRACGLPFIAPELREDRGEIEAARDRRLPKLIEPGDLRGDLHVHTDSTDGRASLQAMAGAAQARGLAYVAITDHSQRQAMSHGLDAHGLARQARAIERFNARSQRLRVLCGVEVDILGDGSLDLPDDVLARLDVVVAAVHSRFDLPRAQQTERVLRAIANPYVTILAHPTGRLLGEREPCDIDMLQIVRKAKSAGVCLELNSQPARLDITDVACRMCKDEGAKVAIDSDAHGVRELAYLRYGVGQARRGWLARENVVNARPLAEMLASLRRAPRGVRASHRGAHAEAA